LVSFGKNIYPSDASVARYLGLSRSAVYESRIKLHKRGLLYRENRPGKSNAYQVDLSPETTPDLSPMATREVMDGNTSDETTLRGFLTKISHEANYDARLSPQWGQASRNSSRLLIAPQ
jgi:DNA-binding transcriptional MocR family regulator